MGFLNQRGCLLTIQLDPHPNIYLICGLLMLHILLLVSITWSRQTEPHPCASAKATLLPRAVSLVVGAFHRLSTIFGGDLYVKFANFLPRVSPVGCCS